MKQKFSTSSFSILLFIYVILFMIAGCGKNDTKNAIDRTIDDFIGKSTIDTGKKMKEQLKQIDEKRKKDLEETQEIWEHNADEKGTGSF